MNPLARKIAELIRIEGAIGLDRYWNLALFDREHGYYAAREPFGRTGDFITAPEISQMFGELIGAWIAAAWREHGSPSPFLLAEIGPGRGTLMADILRTLRSVAPDCLKAAKVRLVETSDRLAAEQMTTLDRFDLPIRRVRRIADLEREPLLLVANELFDALAIRQFVFDGESWRERCVSVADSGRFEFVLCQARPETPGKIAATLPHPPMAGAVLEVSPARETLAAAIAQRLAEDGGAGLFIDYGHAATGFGDTLQAIHGHAFADPLDRPGEADLTSHVDFARIAAPFRHAGLAVSAAAPQGECLLALGLLERAGTLGSGMDEAGQEEIRAAVARLAGTSEKEMGILFKVLSASSRPLSLPPFRLAGVD
ncbi:MAG TPA: class I SAM-dependent methyltransferase [Aurantimonas coralicida]|uniref:Class I SAM-dependent methyltransferase n=2 Tax=root TaxID=1 RepID=A0A9C9NGR6_9HYPH|nr:class I SAM-dependent methyltransferase [Aurantimonas coralicida]HEU01553.1 class I SAM-dependent methyltransferase [Aurantimonas coralicida]